MNKDSTPKSLLWRSCRRCFRLGLLTVIAAVPLVDQQGLAAENSTESLILTVLQPDGKLANGARVHFISSRFIYAETSHVFSVHPPNMTAIASEDGVIGVEGWSERWRIVVTHQSGFAAMPGAALRATNTVVLAPWARIEGVLRANGKPLPGEFIGLTCPIDHGFTYSYRSYHYRSFCITDRDGHFVFPDLPPGDCLLYRVPYQVAAGGPTVSHRWPLVLNAGETNHVDYSFGGRTVIGKVRTDGVADWRVDRQLLVAKLSQADGYAYPDYSSSTDAVASAKEFAAWAISPNRLASERKGQIIQLVFDADGNFRASDVPSGTYELRLRLRTPLPSANAPTAGPRKDIASLVREVIIPAGNLTEEIDLGVIDVPFVGGKPATPPPTFNLTRLDGSELAIESLRGKPVVLVFWSESAPKSAAHLAEFRAFPGNLDPARVVFVTVNLDDPVEKVRATTTGFPTGWIHTRLTGDALIQATEKLSINRVPLTLILDPTGRVTARDLDRDRLQRNLQNLLPPATTK